jgi:hypothetical protein
MRVDLPLLPCFLWEERAGVRRAKIGTLLSLTLSSRKEHGRRGGLKESRRKTCAKLF